MMNISTPSFNNGPQLTITPVKELKTGGSANVYNITFQNHLGTHMDAPFHFDPKGKPMSSYSIDNFVFNHPLLVNIPKGDSEFILKKDLEASAKLIEAADLLLIRTGFQRFRTSDPNRYATRNPGMSPEGAKYIVERFPNLRALALDMISLSPVQHREEGRISHKILLEGRDFFIIEDMNISSFPLSCTRVLAIPLYIEGIDSSPCTVFAET